MLHEASYMHRVFHNSFVRILSNRRLVFSLFCEPVLSFLKEMIWRRFAPMRPSCFNFLATKTIASPCIHPKIMLRYRRKGGKRRRKISIWYCHLRRLIPFPFSFLFCLSDFAHRDRHSKFSIHFSISRWLLSSQPTPLRLSYLPIVRRLPVSDDNSKNSEKHRHTA